LSQPDRFDTSVESAGTEGSVPVCRHRTNRQAGPG
jgi:hypothetical protein